MRWSLCCAVRLKDAGGGVLPDADGAVDVLVAETLDVGAGEEDRADGLVLGRTPAAQAAEIVTGAVRAPGPLLGAEIGEVERERVARLVAEILGEGVQDRLAALIEADRGARG